MNKITKERLEKYYKKYYRIRGQYGTYIFTQEEINKAIDRENNGKTLKKNILILPEADYI